MQGETLRSYITYKLPLYRCNLFSFRSMHNSRRKGRSRRNIVNLHPKNRQTHESRCISNGVSCVCFARMKFMLRTVALRLYALRHLHMFAFSSLSVFCSFFRLRTASVRRNSICPLMERKSSSAQRANSSYNVFDRRSGICFFSAIA